MQNWNAAAVIKNPDIDLGLSSRLSLFLHRQTPLEDILVILAHSSHVQNMSC